MTARAPIPADFREMYKVLSSDGALRAHYGGDHFKIERWREELGLPQKTYGIVDYEFRQAHSGGLTDDQLADRFNVDRRTVLRHRNRLELPRNRRPHTPRHGTHYEYSHHKCRCEECRRANREYATAKQVERVGKTAENGGVAPIDEHGTASTYDNWGCRCPACMDAKRVTNAEQLANRIARTKANGGIAPTKTHGARTWDTWGCRCDVCSASRPRANARERRQAAWAA